MNSTVAHHYTIDVSRTQINLHVKVVSDDERLIAIAVVVVTRAILALITVLN